MWCDEKKDFLHDIEKLEKKLLFSIRLYNTYVENPFLFWRKEHKSTFLAYDLKF